MPKSTPQSDHVQWFRHAAPYINSHRNKIAVIAFSGEAAQNTHELTQLLHDIATLQCLGMKCVVVFGSRPQIDARLKQAHLTPTYHNGLRITDAKTLPHVMEASGNTRVIIESILSMGLPNTAMAATRLCVTSGNFVTAKPYGIRDGIDYQHTGEVRRIDKKSICKLLDDGNLVLLSNIGYSPTGEVFNLNAEDVAAQTAALLNADKLIYITENKLPKLAKTNDAQQLNAKQLGDLLQQRKKLKTDVRSYLTHALAACTQGVSRVHLINRKLDGALITELYTRDGCGTLITNEPYESMRCASINDIGGIMELIQPLQEEGILIKRSLEQLELDIKQFSVLERDGMVLACASMVAYPNESTAELACLAVHHDYRQAKRGARLLMHIESIAIEKNIKQLFVLTTRSTHWFREHGFNLGKTTDIPVKKRMLYNYHRNSKVLLKQLG